MVKDNRPVEMVPRSTSIRDIEFGFYRYNSGKKLTLKKFQNFTTPPGVSIIVITGPRRCCLQCS